MYHPNAYLPNIRDQKPRLKSRSKVLNFLKGRPKPARRISERTKLTYWNTLYHIKLMERFGVNTADLELNIKNSPPSLMKDILKNGSEVFPVFTISSKGLYLYKVNY